ncbi:uncharacterized protein LOC144732178 isoform X4 [Lampetra planeri]
MQVATALCAALLWASRMEAAIYAGVRVRVRPGWAVRARAGDRLSLWCEVTLLGGLPGGPLSPVAHDPDLPAAVTVRWLRVPSSEGGARDPAPLALVLETRGTQAPRAGPGYGARVRSGELCVEAMCGRRLGQKLTLGPLRGDDAGGYACEAAWDLPRSAGATGSGRGPRAVARAYAYVHVDGSGAAVAFSVRVWPPEASSVAEGHRAELWCLVSGLPAFRSATGPGADSESNSAVAVRWFHAPAGVAATEKGSVLLSRTTSGDVWAHERHKSRFASGAVCMEAACLSSSFRLEINDFSAGDGGRYSCEVLDRSGEETAKAGAETILLLLLGEGHGGAATATPPPPGWRHEEEFSGDGEEGGEGAEIPAGLLETTTPPGALFPAEHAFTEEVYFGPLSARVTPQPLVHARQGYPLSLVCEAAGGAATPGSLPPPAQPNRRAVDARAPGPHGASTRTPRGVAGRGRRRRGRRGRRRGRRRPRAEKGAGRDALRQAVPRGAGRRGGRGGRGGRGRGAAFAATAVGGVARGGGVRLGRAPCERAGPAQRDAAGRGLLRLRAAGAGAGSPRAGARRRRRPRGGRRRSRSVDRTDRSAPLSRVAPLRAAGWRCDAVVLRRLLLPLRGVRQLERRRRRRLVVDAAAGAAIRRGALGARALEAAPRARAPVPGCGALRPGRPPAPPGAARVRRGRPGPLRVRGGGARGAGRGPTHGSRRGPGAAAAGRRRNGAEPSAASGPRLRDATPQRRGHRRPAR